LPVRLPSARRWPDGTPAAEATIIRRNGRGGGGFFFVADFSAWATFLLAMGVALLDPRANWIGGLPVGDRCLLTSSQTQ